MMQSRRETLIVPLLLVLLFNASLAAQDWKAIVGDRFLPHARYCADTQTIIHAFYNHSEKSGDKAAQQKALRLLEKSPSIGRRSEELIDTTMDFSAGTGDISVRELGDQWRALTKECRALRKEINPKLVSWSSEQQKESPNDRKATIVKGKPSAPGLPTVLPPKDVLEGIRKQAVKDHPGDYSTQEFVIEKQTAAYKELEEYDRPRAIPAHVFKFLVAKVARDHRGDYSTQLFVLRKQVAAYAELQEYECPKGVGTSHFFRIKGKAARDHPYDFSTQVFVINRQVDAYLRLRNRGAGGDAIIRHLMK
jgi:ribosomal protein L24E